MRQERSEPLPDPGRQLPHVYVRKLPLGFTLTRVSDRKGGGAALRAVPLYLIGLALVLIHELAYRQTGGDDFEFGVISHAGADMLGVVAVLSIASYLMDRKR